MSGGADYPGVPSHDRLRARGNARARRILADLAREMKRVRLASGLSQDETGRRAGLSGDKVWKIEHEELLTVSIADTCVLAAVLGLDFSGRLYPNGATVRDAGQAPRLAALLSNVAPPLTYRTEVPLPRIAEGIELRAWDAVIRGLGERTGIELESRITDAQATIRRHNQKRTDDPVDNFLLVVADTAHNRRVMAEFGRLFGDLPRLKTAAALQGLREGRHPMSGWVFF